jgi:hypothetical protein
MTGGYQTVMFAAGTVGTVLGGALAESSGRLPYLVCAVVYAGVLATSLRRVRGLDAQPATLPGSRPGSQPAPQSGSRQDARPAPAAVVIPAQGPADDGAGLGAADGVAAGEVVD